MFWEMTEDRSSQRSRLCFSVARVLGEVNRGFIKRYELLHDRPSPHTLVPWLCRGMEPRRLCRLVEAKPSGDALLGRAK